jgi:hypothetical protein
MKAVLLMLLAILALGCGASTRATMRQVSEGACQRQCVDDHPDSLYDQNRCLDDCAPPED